LDNLVSEILYSYDFISLKKEITSDYSKIDNYLERYVFCLFKNSLISFETFCNAFKNYFNIEELIEIIVSCKFNKILSSQKFFCFHYKFLTIFVCDDFYSSKNICFIFLNDKLISQKKCELSLNAKNFLKKNPTKNRKSIETIFQAFNIEEKVLANILKMKKNDNLEFILRSVLND
jgi:hypothetical protein